jgi:hypothetical protein
VNLKEKVRKIARSNVPSNAAVTTSTKVKPGEQCLM